MPGVLTGVQCKDQDTIVRALDELMQHAVQHMCDSIEMGEAGMTELPLLARREVRNWVAAMLNKLPVTCQTLRATARTDPRYAAVMYYERTRLGASSSGHFLEGLPAGLSLFSGHTAVALRDDDLRKLRMRDVMCDRLKTVASLELFQNTDPKYVHIAAEYALPDVPTGLPGRIHVFVSRMRGICQGLRRVKPEAHFRQCRNCACNRLFYAGSPVETQAYPVGAPPHSPNGATSFWQMAAGEEAEGDRQSDFCTYSCAREWKWQLCAALPDTGDEVLVADIGCRKTGRARVPEALRLVSKRNERAGRHLRAIEKEHRAFSALSKQELSKQRARVTRMLNVDLGVLYAAGMLAESRGLAGNKVLAGASEGWRSRPAFYAKAVREVGLIYDKSHKSGNVITNLLVHEPFLSKLKQKAKTLF